MSCLRIGSTGAFPWQCRAFADSLSRSPDLSPGLVPVSFVYCLRRPVTSEWVVWSPWSRLPGRLGPESRPRVSVSVFRPRVSVAGLRFRLSAPSRRFRVRTRVLVTCFRFRVSVPVSRLRAVAPVCGPGSWSRVSVSESPFPSLGRVSPFPSLGPRLPGYSTRRFVAVSGKMTQGRNCLASSKSIRA